MNRHLFLAILSSALVLASCGGESSSTSSSSKSTGTSSQELSSLPEASSIPAISESILSSEEESVDPSSSEEEIISSEETQEYSSSEIIDDVASKIEAIKTGHNYTLDVIAYLSSTQDDPFTDTYVNIDDKAYYNTYFDAFSGIIYQKDQGYVTYLQAGENIYPGVFYATNTSIGVSSVYDLVAENLFIADYVKEDNVYACSDEDVIAVASNFSGYIETSWFIAPEKIYLSSYESGLKLNYTFEVGYIDAETADPTFEEGRVEITIHDIGTSSNDVVSAYVENPTYVYETPTDWSNDDKQLFEDYFNHKQMPLVPSASYSYSLEGKDTYDGVNIIYTDYGCGDQLAAYGALLLEAGFEKVSDTEYKLVETNDAANKTTTYLVEMAYVSPSTPSGLHTIGFYYPEGVFQMRLSSRTKNKAVQSIAELNEYMVQSGLSTLLPMINFGKDVRKLTGFEDRTSNMNQLHDGEYLFYTSSNYMRLYIDSFEAAKADAESYIASLRRYGYEGTEVGLGTVSIMNTTWNDDYSSYVSMTDLSNMSASSYPGYIQLRYCIYIPEHYEQPSYVETPVIFQATEHVKALTILDASNNPVDGYNPNRDDGKFYASFFTEDGYAVQSVSVLEDEAATCVYDETNNRFEVSLTKDDLSYITLLPSVEESGYLLSIDPYIQGASIRLTSPAYSGYVNAGERVSFSVTLEEGYSIKKAYLLEDPDYVITSNPMVPTSFSFEMPAHAATISLVLDDGSPSDVTLSSIEVNPTKTTYTVGGEFVFEGTVTAHYSDQSSEDVTEFATFSGYDMNNPGSQIVTVRYEENGIFRTATYTIMVNAASVVTEVSGHTYQQVRRMAGADTSFTLVFNADGTGSYTRDPYNGSTASIYFTYSQTGSSVTLVLAEGSDPFSAFGQYRWFDSDVVDETTFNDTGVVNEDGSLTITVYGLNGSNPSSQTFAFVS